MPADTDKSDHIRPTKDDPKHLGALRGPSLRL